VADVPTALPPDSTVIVARGRGKTRSTGGGRPLFGGRKGRGADKATVAIGVNEAIKF
jgi:hypothetical protein